MKRYFMSDVYNCCRMTTNAATHGEAMLEYFDTFGFMPDEVSIIDEFGGVIWTVK